MNRRITWTLAFSAAALVLASSAQAQGRGKHHRAKHQEIQRNDVFDGGVGGVFNDVYRNDRHIPPGLAKKPGQMPPGQYKKRYNTYEGAGILGDIMRRRGYDVYRTDRSGNSQYVYYRGYDGIAQRAGVYPGNDRLMFDNVPAMVLQAVLARLY